VVVTSYDFSYRQGYGPDLLDVLEDRGYTVEREPARRPGPKPLPLEWLGMEEGSAPGRVRTPQGQDITRRQGQNRLYAAVANRALGGAHDFADSVMTELGRLEDPAVMRQVAEELVRAIEEGRCTRRAHDQVYLLRAWRLERHPYFPRRRLQGTLLDLRQQIERVITDYRTRHQGVDEEMIAEALRKAYWAHKPRVSETVSE
jgi:hypothetical protein